METILQFVQQRKALVALIGGIVLGLALGLLYAWRINPVEYRNATPSHLRADFQGDYIVWIAEQYASTGSHPGDLEWARTRLGVEFWEKKELAKNIERLALERSGEETIRLRALAEALELPEVDASTEEITEAEGQGELWNSLMLICGVLLLVVTCVLGIAFLLRRVREKQDKPGAARRAAMVEEGKPAEAVSWGTEDHPLVQFATTYTLGDDHYDPSYSIELENGEFLGECGIGISERIGVDTPNKITAFEIWLFDKSDIRTVTKVLMSEYAFNDEALRTKLAPKGEPVLAKEGETIVLETKTIRVQARVVEATYGPDLPVNSYFDKLTVDLAAWVIAEPSETPPLPDVAAV